MQLPNVHICVIQPLGYVHSLGFLDQARFFRYQFRRMGGNVTLAKNRLHHDSVNFIFGAHLGFDQSLRSRYTCIFVNLEQLGLGGAAVGAEYLKLLGSSAVIDYDAANVSSYTVHTDDVPLISFAQAPYLAANSLPIEQRPIDILFFGSVNERRAHIISEVEANGLSVTRLNHPIYGPERDELIRQSKAVLNCHFYESARFEQARAFMCMSLGTPVISERTSATQPPAQFEDSIFWVAGSEIAQFFKTQFSGAEFANAAREKLTAFQQHDVIEQYADALAFAGSYRSVQKQQIESPPWRPTRLHIGSGKDYKLGWFNVDIIAAAQPDAVLDLAKPQSWPLKLLSSVVGPVELLPGGLSEIYANNVLEHVPDLPQLMTNCLALLSEGGEMHIEVPHERAETAWQDPTHVRAMNKKSWIYYTDWFWYLGWFDWRFNLKKLVFLDAVLKETREESAHFMRLTLSKVATTGAEKMTARTMQANFGGLPDDLDLDETDGANQPSVEVPLKPETKPAQLAELYLDLMERVLLGVIYEDPPIDQWSGSVFNPTLRMNGRDWPAKAHSMIGFKRLRNLRDLMIQVLSDQIPGDFVETGVWRGGACIYMRAILKAFNVVDRNVWVADSFAGLPMPDLERYPVQDLGDVHYTYKDLAVSLESVQENFRKYDLLDEHVKFLKGWFKDTLPTAPIDRIAILRLDGDMYASTMDALLALGHKVSPGGFIIVDDFGAVEGCRKAVADYRQERKISAPIFNIDGIGAYWQVPGVQQE
jgi:hypothetical protein